MGSFSVKFSFTVKPQYVQTGSQFWGCLKKRGFGWLQIEKLKKTDNRPTLKFTLAERVLKKFLLVKKIVWTFLSWEILKRVWDTHKLQILIFFRHPVCAVFTYDKVHCVNHIQQLLFSVNKTHVQIQSNWRNCNISAALYNVEMMEETTVTVIISRNNIGGE